MLPRRLADGPPDRAPRIGCTIGVRARLTLAPAASRLFRTTVLPRRIGIRLQARR
jgi:uncharacterized protein YbjT (DUF2867 family)